MASSTSKAESLSVLLAYDGGCVAMSKIKMDGGNNSGNPGD
jgi:hypothetical protein